MENHKNGSNDGIMNDITLVKLGVMVLMIWLGVVDEVLKPAIKNLVSWELEIIKHHGIAGDNPLATNFNSRDVTKKRKCHESTE
jgi:hypothetical protein